MCVGVWRLLCHLCQSSLEVSDTNPEAAADCSFMQQQELCARVCFSVTAWPRGWRNPPIITRSQTLHSSESLHPSHLIGVALHKICCNCAWQYFARTLKKNQIALKLYANCGLMSRLSNRHLPLEMFYVPMTPDNSIIFSKDQIFFFICLAATCHFEPLSASRVHKCHIPIDV